MHKVVATDIAALNKYGYEVLSSSDYKSDLSLKLKPLW